MGIVDAPALAGWLFPDEEGPDISSLLTREEVAAPWLIWVELRNILVVIELRGRFEPDDTTAILDQGGKLGIHLDTAADTTPSWQWPGGMD